ncbi:FK506-binding protein 2 precursor [Boeremia exigua]|uniref:FK506-binding protein 2 precursor n=1 Tax=Boeremia exigua TaxID=749465 RepID=UPI001E8DAEAC|nr:FK506-binding protein 2 precursor [Boeremia exigua]KAH6644172.1 FK506-binding protein 2 precursor [Boeremia exigua]
MRLTTLSPGLAALALLNFTPLFGLTPLATAQNLEILTTHAVPCARPSRPGDTLAMQYAGTLTDGTPFDSNVGGAPFVFKLGAGQVIKGWDEGLRGMCVGEERRLRIPPGMAYGGRGTGGIPGESTLVFETVLLEIKGVAKEEPLEEHKGEMDTGNEPVLPSPTPTPAATPIATPTPAAHDQPMPPPPADKSISAALPIPTTPDTAAAAGKHPLDGEDGKGECNLLGDFALLVQGALGLLAVSSLAVKRLREHPRRPLKIWFFDVSKQVFGSVLLHLANILMSMLSSGQFDVAAQTAAAAAAAASDKGDEPNPCSFYLLNLAIDTTLGIPILVLLLNLLHRAFLHTPLANPPESIRSGNYGHPPRATWWLKQSFIYFLGLIGMKLCVLVIFALLPWIAWVGDWALRWTEGNTALQIAFVMFVFPLVMNALQYWIVDGFIKDPAGAEAGYEGVGDEDRDDEDDEADEAWLERRRREVGIDGDEVEGPLKEANPTGVPVRRQYDPAVDGEASKSRTD